MNEESIFLAATQLSEPHRRAEYLAHACAGDSALQHRLQERLAAHDRANDSANVVHVEHGRPGDFDALGTQIVPSAGELPGYAVGEGTRVVLTSGEPEPPDSSPLHRDDPHQGEHDATRIVMIRCETPERRDDEPGEHAATHVALPIEVSSVYSLGEGTRVELRAAEPPEYSDTSQTWISQRQGGADRELSEDLEFNESLSNRPIDLAYLAPSSKPGSLGRLGHYEVDAVLGRGGCGVVLKAFDEKLHRTVAIKVIAPELAGSSPARKRFLREARAAAAVRHENVVTVYAVEEQPIAYQVMEFINGRTLQQRLDQTGPIEAVEALNLAVQLGQGLAAAHAQGLIHRDIKPANILQEHGGERVKVTDFGLARTADDASVTQSGVIAGTPLYMSPEQAAGTAIDARSDLFSLGSVLYALYCGHPPFRAATTLAVLARVVN
ncbi:MAG TPA: serine/threonine-protein kinase, partial [Pirellulales bacterium]